MQYKRRTILTWFACVCIYMHICVTGECTRKGWNGRGYEGLRLLGCDLVGQCSAALPSGNCCKRKRRQSLPLRARYRSLVISDSAHRIRRASADSNAGEDESHPGVREGPEEIQLKLVSSFCISAILCPSRRNARANNRLARAASPIFQRASRRSRDPFSGIN